MPSRVQHRGRVLAGLESHLSPQAQGHQKGGSVQQEKICPHIAAAPHTFGKPPHPPASRQQQHGFAHALQVSSGIAQGIKQQQQEKEHPQGWKDLHISLSRPNPSHAAQHREDEIPTGEWQPFLPRSLKIDVLRGHAQIVKGEEPQEHDERGQEFFPFRREAVPQVKAYKLKAGRCPPSALWRR